MTVLYCTLLKACINLSTQNFKSVLYVQVLTEEERAKLTATPPSAKRAKLATQTSSTAAAGGVAVSAKNKLPTANVAAAGSPKPANGGVAKKKVNLIAVKKTSSGGSSAAASIKKFANLTPQPIQIRKTPKPLTNNGGVSSKAMAQLSHLSGTQQISYKRGCYATRHQFLTWKKIAH